MRTSHRSRDATPFAAAAGNVAAVDPTRPEATPVLAAGGLYGLLRAFLGQAGRRASLLALLTLAVALSDGVGLLMLVPLLQLVGVTGGGAEADGVAASVERFFELAGLPLTLPLLLVAYVVLVAARAAAAYGRDVMGTELRLRFVDAWRERLQRAIGRASWLFLTRRQSSEFSHVLIADVGRINAAIHACYTLLVEGAVALAYVAVSLSLSAAATGLALAVGLLLALLLSPLNRAARRLGVGLTADNKQLFGAVAEFLGGVKMVKSYGAEETQSRAVSARIGAIRERHLGFARTGARLRLLQDLSTAAALCTIVLLAAEALDLPAATLLLLIYIFARLSPLAGRLQQNYLQLAHALPAFEAVTREVAACEAAAEPFAGDVPERLELGREIRLRGVSFAYREGGVGAALTDVDLVIPARTSTAIVGPSGAGKSSLADLVMGLLLPDAGTVEVDGEPLSGERIAGWRRAVAYVPQDAFMFDRTIRENLVWPDWTASEPELWQALEQAAAARFVRALPEGLDAEVGERGVRLSGGERQRIALARALLRRPSLLLLDEATSAVDEENARQIQGAIEALSGRMTVIVIAHRLATLRHVDRVVVLEAGRVVEAGEWAELEARAGGRLRALLAAGENAAPAASTPSTSADSAARRRP